MAGSGLRVNEWTVGTLVGVLKGTYRGKRGKIVEVGHLFLTIEIPGEHGSYPVAKDRVVRVIHENPERRKAKEAGAEKRADNPVPFPSG